MTIQTFQLYTNRGYAGDLVDSGPRVVQTGVLTSAQAGFGKVMSRDAATIDRGVALSDSGTAGTPVNIFAISQREYNHEAGTRPSTGVDTFYFITESVSLIRDGYVYIQIAAGSDAVAAGDVLNFITATGELTAASASTTVIVETKNIVAEQAGIAGDIIKVRIAIVD